MAVSVSSALRPNGAARAADQIYACVNNSSGAVQTGCPKYDLQKQ